MKPRSSIAPNKNHQRGQFKDITRQMWLWHHWRLIYTGQVINISRIQFLLPWLWGTYSARKSLLSRISVRMDLIVMQLAGFQSIANIRHTTPTSAHEYVVQRLAVRDEPSSLTVLRITSGSTTSKRRDLWCSSRALRIRIRNFEYCVQGFMGSSTE